MIEIENIKNQWRAKGYTWLVKKDRAKRYFRLSVKYEGKVIAWNRCEDIVKLYNVVAEELEGRLSE